MKITTAHGEHRYFVLAPDEMGWLAERAGAIEFYSWTPRKEDPYACRFGRILIELDARRPRRGSPVLRQAQDDTGDVAQGDAAVGHHWQILVSGARLVHGMLEERKIQSIPLLAGHSCIALWIPFCDGPHYDEVRHALTDFCRHVVQRYPDRFTLEPDSHVDGRAHLHTGSNAVGRYSVVPYSLRNVHDFPVCTPIRWDELDSVAFGSVTAANFAERLEAVGDVFAEQVEVTKEQKFKDFVVLRQAQDDTHSSAQHKRQPEPHAHILIGTLKILADGHAHTASEICAEGIARGFFPAGTSYKYVYTALIEYIVRTGGHGRKPAVTQDPDRRFRINEPADDWPDTELPAPPPITADAQALIDRLEQTVRGDDPRAFEIAVCDAFAHLGFVATHVGGNENPDGYIDAPLGPLGYRVMLECKTGGSDVHNPDAVEASKFRDPYQAQYCALIGPSFDGKIEFADELQTHGVSAFTVGDLQQLLRIRSNPVEMRVLFERGFASDRLQDLLWERMHGSVKRLTLTCEILLDEGWKAQVAAAHQGTPANAPHINEDGAMLLVDQRLAAEGSSASVSRDDVRLAFDFLTNPLVGAAMWLDEARSGIVVSSGPQSSNESAPSAG